MTDFMLRFLISNLGIALAFAVLLLVKHFLAGYLTSRTQYTLWYLFLGLLIVPVPDGWMEKMSTAGLWNGLNPVKMYSFLL